MSTFSRIFLKATSSGGDLREIGNFFGLLLGTTMLNFLSLLHYYPHQRCTVQKFLGHWKLLSCLQCDYEISCLSPESADKKK